MVKNPRERFLIDGPPAPAQLAEPPRERVTRKRYPVRRARDAGAAIMPYVTAFWARALRNERLTFYERNKAAENLADRFGAPRRQQFEGDFGGGVAIIGPELLEQALGIARERLDADPTGGEVVAVCADYEVVKAPENVPQGGNGSAH